MPDIYHYSYIEKLFDEMSGSYDAVNNITSFGFTKRWRRQCVALARIEPQATVYDLMCGMGECWSALGPWLANGGRLFAFDLSSGMLAGAARRKTRMAGLDITLCKQDVLSGEIESESADYIVSAFGLKTLSDEHKEAFAREIHRILKPGGRFSLIEVSVPPARALRLLYMFYLKLIIPIFGWVFLGNPDNYRMLGVYTEIFGDCRKARDLFEKCGLKANHHEFFRGCATGISGIKE
jgi:demethylmenaquinone methyltransferase/2-methoxy-6-polyprenyl-1,4-benzoquinol methylase